MNQINKSNMLQTLREADPQLQLSIEHVITLLSNNSVAIPEARKYLVH